MWAAALLTTCIWHIHLYVYDRLSFSLYQETTLSFPLYLNTLKLKKEYLLIQINKNLYLQ